MIGTLEQKRSRIDDLQKKMDKICLLMEEGKLSADEADCFYEPFSVEKNQLHKEIREEENASYVAFLNSLKGVGR